jgi:uncharacterized delta-60 repeat protein
MCPGLRPLDSNECAQSRQEIAVKQMANASPYESKADLARRALSRLSARVCASLYACVLALLGSLPLDAAPGDRDPTFGQGGLAAFSFPVFSRRAEPIASALQTNGKLTIAGQCNSANARAACVLRMTPSGDLDASFGVSGQLTIPEFGTSGYVFDIAYQDDGRLLLGGSCDVGSGKSPCVVRLQANGALDTSFGVQGVAILSVATWSNTASDIKSIKPLPDGRIALGVLCTLPNSGDVRFCAAQLQSNGALDVSFGAGGAVTVEPGMSLGEYQVLAVAAIDTAGQWVIAGTCFGAPLAANSFCAVRLHPNGARDLSFGTNGAFVHTVTNVRADLRQAALSIDGGMVLAALCTKDQTDELGTCLVAMTASGLLDPAFGTNGVVRIGYVGDSPRFPRFTRQSDGSLVVVNKCGPSDDICRGRWRSDGTLDPTLSIEIDQRPLGQAPISVAVDAQGRIVVSGVCQSTAASDFDQFCAARYEGGPFANTMCSFDLDGDGQLNPAVDGLIMLRASLGFGGASVLQGVSFPSGAKRNAWGGGGANDLRQYLVSQCGMSLKP